MSISLIEVQVDVLWEDLNKYMCPTGDPYKNKSAISRRSECYKTKNKTAMSVRSE